MTRIILIAVPSTAELIYAKRRTQRLLERVLDSVRSISDSLHSIKSKS